MQITIREPGSALTHYIAMMLALIAAAPLLVKAATQGGRTTLIATFIFITSMVLLYGASALYHSVNLQGSKLRFFKKIDHMMIFVLIAGSYTPVCMISLGNLTGLYMLIAVWTIALIGMITKMLWVTCPKWFSSVIYIAMGWVCVFAFGEIRDALPLGGFLWLLLGGIIYTIGGVIYALKFQPFKGRYPYFGSHEIFHLFVMGGSLCHFIFIYFYVC